jgi:hypothetical protein
MGTGVGTRSNSQILYQETRAADQQALCIGIECLDDKRMPAKLKKMIEQQKRKIIN